MIRNNSLSVYRRVLHREDSSCQQQRRKTRVFDALVLAPIAIAVIARPWPPRPKLRQFALMLRPNRMGTLPLSQRILNLRNKQIRMMTR